LEALAGLRPVSNGSIRVLGRPVTAGVDPGLGDGVALLDQRPFFSAASIADNLRMACPDADDARLSRALAQACAADFVAAAPNGMQTCLGMAGHGLSGGQLHRLALARVFLLDPGLVLLDEPAAHLDAETRMRVIDSILAFCARRTLLITTHDPRIAARMGRVLHIERDGGLLERA
ncbi:MAG TPA: ATP-binding cassette domain-containing protein, partial [Burkholderiaceae bacterium]|nr:ATP-binding cassette domain-containing protein [Burkholderiaceae bacterium]